MPAFFSALDKLPPWMGSLPAWSLLILVIGWIVLQRVKNQPVIRQQDIDERLAIKSGYIGRITQLEADVLLCRENCDAQEIRLQTKIDRLQDQLNNEAIQRVQGEISLINTLIDVVDAPQLKAILQALEKRQLRLQIDNVQLIEGKDDGRLPEQA